MAMGYSATFVIVPNEDDLEKMDSFKRFKKVLNSLDVDIEHFAESYTSDDDFIFNKNAEQLSDVEKIKLFQAYETFTTDFYDKYGVGIELDYHSSESRGSAYDDVDGYYFSLNFGDMYELTPNAKKMQEKIGFKDAYFVYYG